MEITPWLYSMTPSHILFPRHQLSFLCRTSLFTKRFNWILIILFQKINIRLVPTNARLHIQHFAWVLSLSLTNNHNHIKLLLSIPFYSREHWEQEKLSSPRSHPSNQKQAALETGLPNCKASVLSLTLCCFIMTKEERVRG